MNISHSLRLSVHAKDELPSTEYELRLHPPQATVAVGKLHFFGMATQMERQCRYQFSKVNTLKCICPPRQDIGDCTQSIFNPLPCANYPQPHLYGLTIGFNHTTISRRHGDVTGTPRTWTTNPRKIDCFATR